MGVDGCRGGWIGVLPRGRACEFRFEGDLAALLAELQGPGLVLVDMIIGLPGADSGGTRRCDQLARARLGPVAGRRVFSAPPSAALGATDYAEACELARAQCGKALSKQAWYLMPKVREVASCLEAPAVRERGIMLCESHPELAFLRLNGGSAVLPTKKTALGQGQRLALLEQCFDGFVEELDRFSAELPRGVAVLDDLLDAAALAAVGEIAERLPAESETRDIGTIVY